MVDLEIASLLIFITIVGLLLLKDRKNVSFHYGLIIRRWTKGMELIDKLVKKYPTFIRRLGNFGVLLGVIAGVGGAFSLIILTLSLQSDVRLILPTAGGYQIPGPVLSVPFWYWLIAIFIIVVTHETMHAVYARLDKVPVKNYGILLLLLLPIGAFVDPDNKRIKRLDLLKKLRIFAAGSMSNIITALVALAIFMSSAFAFGSVTNVSGVMIDSVTEGSPADDANLQGTVQKINDVEINDGTDFVKSLNNTKPGDEITIATDKGNYNLVLGEHPEIGNRSYIGITVRAAYDYKLFGFDGAVPMQFLKVFFVVLSFLNWLAFLSFALGIVNMLPIKPFDGGLFFGEILTKMFKDKGTIMINISTFALLGLLIFNLFGVSWLRTLIG